MPQLTELASLLAPRFANILALSLAAAQLGEHHAPHG